MEDQKKWAQWNWKNKFRIRNLNTGEIILDAAPFEIDHCQLPYTALVDGVEVKCLQELPGTYEELLEADQKMENLSSVIVCKCGKDSGRCIHVAAFLMAWERQIHPFSAQRPMEGEEEIKEGECLGAASILPEDWREEEQYFHLREALSPYECTYSEYQLARERLLEGSTLSLGFPSLSQTGEGRTISFQGNCMVYPQASFAGDCTVDVRMSQKKILTLNCSCQRFQSQLQSQAWQQKKGRVCHHILLGIRAIAEYMGRMDTGEMQEQGDLKDPKEKDPAGSAYEKNPAGSTSEKSPASTLSENDPVGRTYAINTEALTDARGMNLIRVLRREDQKLFPVAGKRKKRRPLFLFPQLEVKEEGISFSMQLSTGEEKARLYPIPDLSRFVEAAENKEELSLSKEVTLHLGAYQIDEEGLFWFGVLQQLVLLHEKILEEFEEAPQLGETDQFLLEGEMLDLFYQLCEGHSLPCRLDKAMEEKRLRERQRKLERQQRQEKRREEEGQESRKKLGSKTGQESQEESGSESGQEPGALGKDPKTERESPPEGEIQVGRVLPLIHICLLPDFDQTGGLKGVSMQGEMPIFYPGRVHRYFLKEGKLSLLEREEEKRLSYLEEIAGPQGSLDCYIGTKQFQSFYYRAMPVLAVNPLVDLEDHCPEIGGQEIPSPAKFSFYLDREKERDSFTCMVKVKYGKISLWLGGLKETLPELLRDELAEEEVCAKVEEFFPVRLNGSSANRWVKDALRDEEVYEIYMIAVPTLKTLGSIMVTEDFSSRRVRSFAGNSSLKLNISSGMLMLGFVNKDGIDATELSQLYESYSQKRRFHRLEDGSLVDLEDADILEDLEALSQQVHLSVEDMLGGKANIPLYRALYLYQMMKEREIPFTRDKMVSRLMDSFEEPQKREYPVPSMGEALLRPYQVYGYRWLRCIGENGFGGILGDDMGLGKTLQVLTLLKAWKEEGREGSSLVVCPASLVYNWKAEAERFAPGLRVRTVDGPLSQRKPLLLNLESDTQTDLYLVSYDMVRRDVAFYQKVCFLCLVLDEAQYIKNEATAISKAVKSLKAKHRFALTGTPIENRLLELWSIFDFLMPGFLYSAKEFHSSIEMPIMKYRDQDKAKALSAQVGPFILRRLKSDVLKDLPEKLEETRQAQMEGEQAMLYDAQVLHLQELLENAHNQKDKMRVLVEIMRLRQLCCDPSLVYEDYRGGSAKRELCHELLKMAIEGGHRVLLFSQYTSMLDILAGDLEKKGIDYYMLTGSTPKEERVRLVNAFNGGNVPVFLISLKAGGTGLNLTGADVVIHYDPWWNVSAQNQATDRTHRIGQTRVVTVYKLIIAGTIEEKIVRMQKDKKELADAILEADSASILTMSKEDLMELLRREEK